MQIERLDLERDEARMRECYEIFRAASEAEERRLPPWSPAMFAAWLRLGWIAEPRETWYLAGDGGMAGWYVLELPVWDNRHLAFAEVTVPPSGRRQGRGTALLRHAAERALADGRRLLMGRVRDGSAGEAFARRAGASAGLADERRVLDVRARAAGTVRAASAEGPAGAGTALAAARVAAGYELVSWTGATPESDLEQVAALNAAFSDSPLDESWEREVWDADRVRAADRAVVARPVRAYTLAARHLRSGELAGLTQLSVLAARPDWAFQGLTAVVAKHRGHGLGLALKTAMLAWLAGAEPALEHVMAMNAASNEHMVAINEALGFKPDGTVFRCWETPLPWAQS